MNQNTETRDQSVNAQHVGSVQSVCSCGRLSQLHLDFIRYETLTWKMGPKLDSAAFVSVSLKSELRSVVALFAPSGVFTRSCPQEARKDNFLRQQF